MHGTWKVFRKVSSTRVSKIRFRVVFMVKDIQVMCDTITLLTLFCVLMTVNFYFCPPYIHVEQVESWD